MKKIIALLLILLCYNCYSQDNRYNKGLYSNINETINNSPSKSYDVELEKRKTSKIKMNGGNDYQINAINKSVKRKSLKRDFWAYSDGKDLYINCFIQNLQWWYTKVLSDGKYYVFKAGLPLYPKEHDFKINQLPNIFGGLIGGLQGAKLATVRLPYIINKADQKVTLITDKNIRTLIKSNKILLEKYNGDSNIKNPDTIIKYLILWNEQF